jgi:hypothetical protein
MSFIQDDAVECLLGIRNGLAWELLSVAVPCDFSGAVMFLFEGEFGIILHTGDCRLTPDCVQDLPMKYIAKKGKENICHLDFVFLDCTFSKCFLKLPSKESAIQQVSYAPRFFRCLLLAVGP